MNIVVYFENSISAEKVAQFSSEKLYVACLPALEAEAQKDRLVVTESCSELGDVERECIHILYNNGYEDAARSLEESLSTKKY